MSATCRVMSCAIRALLSRRNVAERRQRSSSQAGRIAQGCRPSPMGGNMSYQGAAPHDLPSRPRSRRPCLLRSRLDRLCGRGRVAPGAPWPPQRARPPLPRGVDAPDAVPRGAHGRYADQASLQNGTAFFASTSLLAVGGALTLMRATGDVVTVLEALPFRILTTPTQGALKTIG